MDGPTRASDVELEALGEEELRRQESARKVAKLNARREALRRKGVVSTSNVDADTLEARLAARSADVMSEFRRQKAKG